MLTARPHHHHDYHHVSSTETTNKPTVFSQPTSCRCSCCAVQCKLAVGGELHQARESAQQIQRHCVTPSYEGMASRQRHVCAGSPTAPSDSRGKTHTAGNDTSRLGGRSCPSSVTACTTAPGCCCCSPGPLHCCARVPLLHTAPPQPLQRAPQVAAVLAGDSRRPCSPACAPCAPHVSPLTAPP